MAGNQWIEVGQLADIPLRGARVVRTPQADIAVFRTGEDRVFALDDRCPHQGGPLSEGLVHGDRVACPLHGWRIELSTGEAVAPDEGCTASHPVKVEDGIVYLALYRFDSGPARESEEALQ